jgi:hypothetical protein
MNILS